MGQNFEQNVRVVLGETNPELRSAFQTAFYRRGWRDIEICRDSAGLFAYLQQNFVDLIVVADDLPGLDFTDVIQQVRHKNIGRNPFALILATVQDATLAQVRKLINSGVDRVVSKPLSIADMLASVQGLIISRKPFVATDSYVGPTRRASSRQGQFGEEAIDVPNSLRLKDSEMMAPALEPIIHQSMEMLEDLRSRNAASAIGRSVDRLSAHLKGQGSQMILLQELSRLFNLSEGVQRRLDGTSYAHFADVAASLGLLSEKMAALPEGAEAIKRVTLDLMRKLSEILARIDEGENGAMAVSEIAARVRVFADNALHDPI